MSMKSLSQESLSQELSSKESSSGESSSGRSPFRGSQPRAAAPPKFERHEALPRPAASELTPAALHEQAVRAFRVGNRGRLSLIRTLSILHHTRLYEQLGFSSVAGYAEAHFDYCRSETYEALRVADALEELPRILEAFDAGKIGWSVLKEITRVAGSATQEQWLEHAASHTVAEVRAEVQDAIEKKRETPRSDRYGLPNLKQRLVLRLSRSDGEKLLQGLGRLEEDVAARLGGARPALEDLLLYVAERLLEAGPEAIEERGKGGPAGYALVYQTCPECLRAGVHTGEGLVEVSREEVDRIAGEAVAETVETVEIMETVGAGESVETAETVDPEANDGPATDGSRAAPPIDRPTPPKLRRQVLLRDGQRCANPLCRHRADHCHHIVFRSRGGRTVAANEVALCGSCHSLVHAGLLKVTGSPDTGLRWSTKSACLGAGLTESRLQADALPVFRVESARTESARTDFARTDSGNTQSGNTRSGNTQSAYTGSGEGRSGDAVSHSGPDIDELSGALVKLGFTRRESRNRLVRAAERLGDGPHDESALLRAALSYRKPGSGS